MARKNIKDEPITAALFDEVTSPTKPPRIAPISGSIKGGGFIDDPIGTLKAQGYTEGEIKGFMGLSTDAAPIIGEEPTAAYTPIVSTLADAGNVQPTDPRLVETTPKKPFDWDAFQAITGMLGASLGGPLAPLGATASQLARTRIEQGVAGGTRESIAGLLPEEAARAMTARAAGKKATQEEEMADLDRRIKYSQALYNLSGRQEDLENTLALEQEKSRLRIEETEAEQPGKAAAERIKTAEKERVEATKAKTTKLKAVNAALKSIRDNDTGRGPLSPEDQERLYKIIAEMEISEDDTSEVIRIRAIDILREEKQVEADEQAKIQQGTITTTPTTSGGITQEAIDNAFRPHNELEELRKPGAF